MTKVNIMIAIYFIMAGMAVMADELDKNVSMMNGIIKIKGYQNCSLINNKKEFVIIKTLTNSLYLTK